eukprot:TRINITY_DN22346_c0_g1_i1.p2 TRINITY_DN22346_c0_g1~~TRINITY_DN22346_c0_g1_i1.p2  ORF type:complete len:104 (+),score=14.93 TRINITY_DN22346_c0_g1_i1:249-560(+)
MVVCTNYFLPDSLPVSSSTTLCTFRMVRTVGTLNAEFCSLYTVQTQSNNNSNDTTNKKWNNNSLWGILGMVGSPHSHSTNMGTHMGSSDNSEHLLGLVKKTKN